MAVACSVCFAAGYVFHQMFGFERDAARQAVFEARAIQRVIAAYSPVINNHAVFAELSSVSTLDGLAALRRKYREATVSAVEFYERQAATLEFPEEKRFAKAFVEEAARIKAVVTAAP
jgi:hypothetical protein